MTAMADGAVRARRGTSTIPEGDRSAPLRIGVVAPIARAIRRNSEYSIEQLVSLLCEDLVRLGHDVTLFATADSETSARLNAIYPRGYVDDADLWNWQFHESMHVAAAFERAGNFDVLHSHNYCLALPFDRLVDTPVLHTYHILPDLDIARAFAARRPSVAAISHFQAGQFVGFDNIPVIYHGIDVAAFPFSDKPGDYLLFLGRVVPGKGPIQAIRTAQAAGLRLILAGPGDEYLRDEIMPLVDGSTVEYVGPVTHRERNVLLAGAAALVYPILAPEPFGLVMVEAMACGTPVVAFDRGAAREVVDEHKTGYLASDTHSLAQMVPAAGRLDRQKIRARVAERFDHTRMTAEYLSLYSRMLSRVRGGA